MTGSPRTIRRSAIGMRPCAANDPAQCDRDEALPSFAESSWTVRVGDAEDDVVESELLVVPPQVVLDDGLSDAV